MSRRPRPINSRRVHEVTSPASGHNIATDPRGNSMAGGSDLMRCFKGRPGRFSLLLLFFYFLLYWRTCREDTILRAGVKRRGDLRAESSSASGLSSSLSFNPCPWIVDHSLVNLEGESFLKIRNCEPVPGPLYSFIHLLTGSQFHTILRMLEP